MVNILENRRAWFT